MNEKNELSEEGRKNILLLELIVRLAAVENLLIKKNLFSKEELINEVTQLTQKAAEAASIDNDSDSDK